MSMENPEDKRNERFGSRLSASLLPDIKGGEMTILTNLEKILSKKGKQVKLEALDVSPGCSPGENFVADVIRIVACGRCFCSGIWTDFRQNYVIKKIPDRDSLRYKYHDCGRLFENEITAYEVVLPLLHSYSNKRWQNEVEGLCFPRYYGQCQAFLVLEDLQTMGYQMVNRVKGFGKRECLLILQELSKFHAVSFALKKNEKTPFLEVVNLLKETVILEEHKNGMMGVVWENSLTFAIRSLTESNDAFLMRVAEKLKIYTGKVVKTLCKVIESTSPKFSVICHGDLWNNNIMLRYCNSGYPIGVKFIDLQLMRHSSCVLDIMHVLFTSSRPSVHEKHLNELILGYYNSLVDNLKNLGESVDFTFDEFIQEFNSNIIFGVFFASLMYTCITRTSEPEATEADSSVEALSSQRQMENMYKSLNSGYHKRLRSLFVTLTSLNLV